MAHSVKAGIGEAPPAPNNGGATIPADAVATSSKPSEAPPLLGAGGASPTESNLSDPVYRRFHDYNPPTLSPPNIGGGGGQNATNAARAKWNRIRYAQCWEDADVLLDAMDVQPGDTCVSIASAGDNALALLTRDPARVIALDLSAAQIYCCRLRVAAYLSLTHVQLLQFIGSTDATERERLALYARCSPQLPPNARAFWDDHLHLIGEGIGNAGKFERYFALFRRFVLPLTQSRRTISRLLEGADDEAARTAFYENQWDNPRWRLLFRVFFGRFLLGRLGRDPAFFDHVDGDTDVAARLLARARRAVTVQNPARNSYLRWILTGRHAPNALPLALRPEHFETIRDRAHRVEWRQQSVEAWADETGRAGAAPNIGGFNLSDIFEYMTLSATEDLLARLVRLARPGARFCYWNLLAPRSRPQSLAAHLRPLPDLAARLHARDQAFFYGAFVVEEATGKKGKDEG